MRIRRLGHVALTTPDLDRAVDFYRRIVGLEVSHREEGAVYFKCNSQHHSLALYEGEAAGVHHLGLEVGSEEEVREAALLLQRHGVAITDENPQEPAQGPAIRFRDPSGFTLEIYAGMEQVPAPTGSLGVMPRKFGHFTAMTTDIERATRFYTEVLGFRVSDWMQRQIVWMRCNPDHHGIAFIQADQNRMHHHAWELVDWGEIRAAGDHLLSNNVRILFGPGRHGPGRNLFMYYRDPDGNLIEFFTDLQQIWDDDTYEPLVWEDSPVTINQWGPAPPPEFFE